MMARRACRWRPSARGGAGCSCGAVLDADGGCVCQRGAAAVSVGIGDRLREVSRAAFDHRYPVEHVGVHLRRCEGSVCGETGGVVEVYRYPSLSDGRLWPRRGG